jgi:hypothetical protein
MAGSGCIATVKSVSSSARYPAIGRTFAGASATHPERQAACPFRDRPAELLSSTSGGLRAIDLDFFANDLRMIVAFF